MDTITLRWDSSSVNGVQDSYKYSYIDRSSSDPASEMINVDEASGVDVSVDVSVTAGHQYTFSVYTVRYEEISEASTVDATAGELWISFPTF